ncbi:SRPBCC family protein, partial [Blastomonas sp. UPD001]|uniref:SRPBCC family protein n=1 Tax=Blastomonas sp. UPD001 TaxID=2217673 RepID=UPI0018E515F3
MRTAFAALAAMLAATTLAATPARAEVVQQADNGFVVQASVTVATDPDATFAMLRTPAKWWDKDHTWTGNAENLYMDAQAGGCFCELIPNETTTEGGAPQRTLRGSVQHMQILYVDPGRLLRLSGALGPLQSEAVTGAMTLTLKPVKGGTRITLDYVVGGFLRMKTGDIAPAVDKVLAAQLS